MADWGQVDTARTAAESAARTANEFSARGNTLADELRKAVGERFGESDIAKNTAQARADFITAAPKARSDVLSMVQGGTILSPTQQSQIMAAKKASALVPLMGANMVQEATYGTLEDILNAGVNAYKAESARQSGLAQIAQQSYSSLLNELVTRAQQEQQAQQMSIQKSEADRAAELFPLQKQQLQAQIAATNRSNAGGGGAGRYGDNDVTRAAGLVGMPITEANNEKLAYQQYLYNLSQQKTPTGAQIQALQKQGYDYDPVTGQYSKAEPKSLGEWVTKKWNWITGQANQ